MKNTIGAIARVRVTLLGSRAGAGLLLSSLQRVELHRQRVWRCNTSVMSRVCHEYIKCYTHHNKPVLGPLSHVVAAQFPGQFSLILCPAGLAVVCHLVTIRGAASPPPGHVSRVTCHVSQWGSVTGVTCNLHRQHSHVWEGASPLAGGRTCQHNQPWEVRVRWRVSVMRVQTSLPFPDAPSQGRSWPFTPSHL